MNQETSEYSVNLSEEDFARYREKLKLATGEQLPDPYILKEKWTNDISNLPEITWRDVTPTPSAYTKEYIKACKSLEAYDYFVCGRVQNCYYHEISPESTSSLAHLFAIRGRRKRGPGTLDITHVIKIAQIEGIFLRINYEIRGRRY